MKHLGSYMGTLNVYSVDICTKNELGLIEANIEMKNGIIRRLLKKPRAARKYYLIKGRWVTPCRTKEASRVERNLFNEMLIQSREDACTSS